MLGKTHLAVGVLTSLAIGKAVGLPLNDALIVNQIIISGAVGGLLPDIDHSGSKLGSKVPILPKLLKHRGITHTVFFVALVYFIAISLNTPQKLIYCLTGAIISHIIGDMLTPAGIAPIKIFGLFDYNIKFPIMKIPYLEKVTEVGAYYLALQLLIS
ncbi:MAG: metal-dependent hydrolase [Culicoidibacterales bacterium]